MTLSQAAVLVVYRETKSGLHLFFIERSKHESDPHSGQIAFPGGRYEADDADLECAALREAEEEIGLKPENVKVIGSLSPVITGTGFEIYPYLAKITSEFEAVLHDAEVASLFTIPVNWLRHAKTHTRVITRNEQTYEVLYFEPFEGKVLWGASAGITVNAIDELIKRQLIS